MCIDTLLQDMELFCVKLLHSLKCVSATNNILAVNFKISFTLEETMGFKCAFMEKEAETNYYLPI